VARSCGKDSNEDIPENYERDSPALVPIPENHQRPSPASVPIPENRRALPASVPIPENQRPSPASVPIPENHQRPSPASVPADSYSQWTYLKSLCIDKRWLVVLDSLKELLCSQSEV
jgi:hypothetical protein